MTYDKPEMPASQESNQIAESAYQALFADSRPIIRAINDESVKPFSSNTDSGLVIGEKTLPLLRDLSLASRSPNEYWVRGLPIRTSTHMRTS